jgi:hypothetical protein
MNSPVQMLFQIMKSRGINLPTNINMNDPNAILQYLMQNGKITQEQYNKAYNEARRMFPANQSVKQ